MYYVTLSTFQVVQHSGTIWQVKPYSWRLLVPKLLSTSRNVCRIYQNQINVYSLVSKLRERCTRWSDQRKWTKLFSVSTSTLFRNIYTNPYYSNYYSNLRKSKCDASRLPYYNGWSICFKNKLIFLFTNDPDVS